MNRITTIALLALLCACSGTPTEEQPPSSVWYTVTPEWARDIPVPGQEGRIDGSVWNDGLFRTEEARQQFCGEYGDMEEAWFCSELGTAEQAWRSVEYHGITFGGPGSTCYGPGATNGSGDCIFPEMKHIRIVQQLTNCFEGAAPPNGPSLLQEQAIILGVVEGILQWNNVGNAYGNSGARVVVDGTPGTEWYAPLYLTCKGKIIDPSAYAVGGIVSNAGDPRVANLPLGPHSGKDQDDARVGKKLVLDINVPMIWQHAVDACPGDATSITGENLRKFVWPIGVHEAGHTLGFGHFLWGGDMANQVMYPWRSPSVCAQGWFIEDKFHRAVGYLETAAAGGTSIPNEHLYLLTPN